MAGEALTAGCCCLPVLTPLIPPPISVLKCQEACCGHLWSNSFYFLSLLWETAPILVRQWVETNEETTWLEETERIPISQKRQEEKHWEQTQASSQESRHCLFLAGAAEWKLLVVNAVGGKTQPGSGYGLDSVTSKWFSSFSLLVFSPSPPFA